MRKITKPLVATVVAASLLILHGCGGESDDKLTASAKGYVDAKDFRAATIQLKVLLQRNPDSAMGRFLMGKTLLETGDAGAALVELRKASELATPEVQVLPEIARAMILAGEHAKVALQYAETQLKEPQAQADLSTSVAVSFGILGNLEKAREHSDRALRAVPRYPQAMVLQARLKAAEGDLDGTLVLLNEVLAKDPGNERAGVMKGELQWQAKQDPEGALTTLRQVLAASPKAVGARVALVGVLSAQDKIAEVKTQLVELQKVAPNHPDTLFIEAQLAFQGGNFTLARDITARILKAMPDSVRVLALAGAAEYRLNSFLQADNHLSRALKLQPTNLMVRQLLAQTHLRAGQATKAIEALLPAIEGANADGASLALAGEAYLQQGDNNRADDAFKRAAKSGSSDPKVRTTLALVQYARGDTTHAMSELEAISAGDKGPRADLALISARLRSNDTAGALKAVDALQAKMADRPLPDLLRGRILAFKQDLAGAAAAYEAALKKDANYFPAISSLASIDVAAGRGEVARKRLEGAIATDATNHHAFMALAEVQARSGGTPAEVAKTLAAAVKASPNQQAPHLALVEQYLRMGDTQAALVAAQDANAALPNESNLLGALGRALLASGDSQQAVSTFTKLASLNPRSAQVQIRLADAFMLGKDPANARRALLKAIELEPENVGGRRALAAVALSQGRASEALEIARTLQKSRPKDFNGFVLEGDIHRQQRQWQASTVAYRTAFGLSRTTEQAVRYHQALFEAGQRADADRLAADWQKEQPEDVAFRYYLGDTALARGDLPNAETLYRTVLQAQPRNALALNNVAWLMARQGKPGAVKVAEEANQLMPNRPAMLDTLALAFASENNVKRAIEVQRQAIALDRNDPSLRLNLAKYYLRSGEKPQARAELEDLARLGDKFAAQREVTELLQSAR